MSQIIPRTPLSNCFGTIMELNLHGVQAASAMYRLEPLFDTLTLTCLVLAPFRRGYQRSRNGSVCTHLQQVVLLSPPHSGEVAPIGLKVSPVSSQ